MTDRDPTRGDRTLECSCCGGPPSGNDEPARPGGEHGAGSEDTTSGEVGQGLGTGEEKPSRTDPRWLGRRVLETPLPDELGHQLGRLLGGDQVETLGGWLEAVRRATGGGAIDVDDLCDTDTETDHWGVVDAERHFFRCFYDAVVLAVLLDRPVDVRTETPAGTTLQFQSTADGLLRGVPPGTVVSFGVDEGVPAPADDPDAATVYGTICPNVRAFSGWDAYVRWAAAVDAATVAMPLIEAHDVARALTE